MTRTPRRRSFSALIAILCSAGIGSVAQAQSAPAPVLQSRNAGFSGVWQVKGYQASLRPIDGGTIPFTAEGRRRFAEDKAAVAKSKDVDTARFLCLPQGPARAITTAYPFRIFQTDRLFVILYEENRVFQRVRVDGEYHDPEFWDPSFMGDSIGKWDGQTFVVRTRNFREKIFLDDALRPGGENSEVEQRFTLSADGRNLDVLVTIKDPTLYTRPWSSKLSFEARPDLEVETSDWVCGEPHRDVSAIPGLAAAPASHPSRGASRPPLATPIRTAPSAVTAGQRQIGGIWSMLAAGLKVPSAPPPLPDGRPAPKPTDSLFPDSLTRLLKPWNLEPYVALRSKMAAGNLFPTPDNSCLPFLVPATAAYYGPYEILISDDLILLLFQADHQSRIVYMNAELPAAPPLRFTGTSVGKWDGNSLVITSTGWGDRTLIKQVARHTDALHVTERSTLAEDGKHLIVSTTFEDPGALTAPWHIETRPARDQEEYQEYVNGEVSEYFPCPTADTGSTFPRHEQPKR